MSVTEAQKNSLAEIKDMLGAMIAEAVEEQMAALKQPANSGFHGIGTNTKPVSQEIPKYHGLARCCRYLAAAGNDTERAISLARRDNQGQLAEAWEATLTTQRAYQEVLRAAGQDTLAGGGALVPPGFVADFIEELGAEAVVRSAGLGTVPMRGSLTMPYIDTAPTAGYVGEAAVATESSPTFGQLMLSDKKLVGLSAVSNELLANGSPKAEEAIRGALVRSVQRKEDITFLTGIGASTNPKGMLYWCPAANKFDANGTTNLANTKTDLYKAIGKIMANDVPLPGLAWFFSHGTWVYLSSLADGNGNDVYKEEMSKGTLLGFPYRVTSQIVENGGVGTNESKIYLANVAKGCVLGESMGMDVKVFPDGSYYDGSSTVSGISTDQTVIRVIERHDFGCQYRGKELAIIEAVLWGRA
jgi:HK97 family phage major capsid protein